MGDPNYICPQCSGRMVFVDEDHEGVEIWQCKDCNYSEEY